MLLLTDKDVARAIAAIELTISTLSRDRTLARAQRDETIAEFQDTRRKLEAASRNAAKEARKLLTPP